MKYHIMAAQGGISGVSIYKNTVKYGIFVFLNFGGHFRILYGVPEAQEASKNLPGARGSVLT